MKIIQIKRFKTYHAARIKIGPPTNEIGARTAPYNKSTNKSTFEMDFNFF